MLAFSFQVKKYSILVISDVDKREGRNQVSNRSFEFCFGREFLITTSSGRMSS